MKNIHIEEVSNGFVLRVFESASGDETRAQVTQESATVFADNASLIAAVTALFSTLVVPTESTPVVEQPTPDAPQT